MNLVLPHPEQSPPTSRGHGLGFRVHIELGIVDVLAMLKVIRAGLKHSPGMNSILAERMIALHEFLMHQLPARLRDRILRGTFLG